MANNQGYKIDWEKRVVTMTKRFADEANEYGQFLRFETLTMVPFDLNLIDKQYLDEKTINLINDYHEKVYQTLLPYLNDEEAQFLRRKTVKL